MKKFWLNSGHFSLGDLRGRDTEMSFTQRPQYSASCIDGRVNLAYENEQQPGRLENIEEEEEEGEASFASRPEQKGLPGLQVSPHRHAPVDGTAHGEEEAGDEDVWPGQNSEDEDDFKDYDIHQAPPAGISRARLLSQLFDKLDRIEEMCLEPDCPYNRWLYVDAHFPGEDMLLSWEQERWERDHRLEEGDSSRRTGLEGGERLADISSLSHTRKEDLTASPYTPQSISYPIITLPRSVRKSLKEKKPSLSSWPESRPSSACSCSSRSSSHSSCSSCIPVPDNPNAPYAFTVKDRPPPANRGRRRPCDISSCATLSFMTVCLLGLLAVLLYLHFNTKAMHHGMTEN